MVNFLLSGFFWVFFLYGLIEFIKTIYYTIYYTNLRSDGIYFIIATKNQEDKIEMFLRSIVFRILYGKENSIKNIIVTDLESKDNTKKIVENLNKEYPIIKPLSWKNCKELIDNIEKN